MQVPHSYCVREAVSVELNLGQVGMDVRQLRVDI